MLLDVTYGYVPKSTSSMAPCAPSRKTSRRSRTALVQALERVADERLQRAGRARAAARVSRLRDSGFAPCAARRRSVSLQLGVEQPRANRSSFTKSRHHDARAQGLVARRPARSRGPSCRCAEPRSSSAQRGPSPCARASRRGRARETSSRPPSAMARGLEGVDLRDELDRVHHDAVADDPRDAAGTGSRSGRGADALLGADDDRVTGVGAALAAHDHVDAGRRGRR